MKKFLWCFLIVITILCSKNISAFELSTDKGVFALLPNNQSGKYFSTTFQVYLKTGENAYVSTWYQAKDGSAYPGYKLASNNASQFDAYNPSDVEEAKNKCINGEVYNSYENLYYFEVYLYDDNNNLIDEAINDDAWDVGNVNDTMDWSSKKVENDGIYTIKIRTSNNFINGKGDFYWSQSSNDSKQYYCKYTQIDSSYYAKYYNWKFDAQKDGTIIPGRVWTKSLDLKGDNIPANPFATKGRFNATLYTVDNLGYQYKVNLNNYDGSSTNITFSPKGILDTSGNSIDKSVFQYIGGPSVSTDPNKLFMIFTEPPASDIPKDILPNPIDSKDKEIGKIIDLVQNDSNTRAGDIKYWLSNAYLGAYKILIDTNNNGSYDDDVDVILNETATGGSNNGSVTDPLLIKWDGLDGKKNQVLNTQAINIKLEIKNPSKIYFVLQNVQLFGGIIVEQLNGSAAGNSIIYWDDTGYSNDAIASVWNKNLSIMNNDIGSGGHYYPNELDTYTSKYSLINYDMDMTKGVDSNNPNNWPDLSNFCINPNLETNKGVHGWCNVNNETNYNATWGNLRAIESWVVTDISQSALNNTIKHIGNEVIVENDVVINDNDSKDNNSNNNNKHHKVIKSNNNSNKKNTLSDSGSSVLFNSFLLATFALLGLFVIIRKNNK
ncbi:MAG: hypothetical protein LBR40_05310 [Bacilli bacterium]|jgi:hypothetical protein|nr:hypothetical protein [Bacilli bacterium]